MNIKSIITKNIFLGLSDFIQGQDIRSYFQLLMKSEWWTKGELENYQNERLQVLIKSCV